MKNNMEKLKKGKKGKPKIAGLIVPDAGGPKVLTFAAGEELRKHEYSKRLPKRTPEQQEALELDILTNGINEPIDIFEGEILCGRHRYDVCIKHGLEIPYRVFEGSKEDASLYARSSNSGSSVQYTKSQLAMAAAMDADVQRLFQLATERKNANLKSNGSEITKIPFQGSPTEFASKIYSVNGKYVRDACKILEFDKELAGLVFDGEKTLAQAKSIMDPPNDNEADPTPKQRLSAAVGDWKKNVKDEDIDLAIQYLNEFFGE